MWDAEGTYMGWTCDDWWQGSSVLQPGEGWMMEVSLQDVNASTDFLSSIEFDVTFGAIGPGDEIPGGHEGGPTAHEGGPTGHKYGPTGHED